MSTHVTVTNLAVALQETHLRDLFAVCGPIRRLELAGQAPSPRVCVIEYESEAAARAAEIMNGTLIGEHKLKVALASPAEAQALLHSTRLAAHHPASATFHPHPSSANFHLHPATSALMASASSASNPAALAAATAAASMLASRMASSAPLLPVPAIPTPAPLPSLLNAALSNHMPQPAPLPFNPTNAFPALQMQIAQIQMAQMQHMQQIQLANLHRMAFLSAGLPQNHMLMGQPAMLHANPLLAAAAAASLAAMSHSLSSQNAMSANASASAPSTSPAAAYSPEVIAANPGLKRADETARTIYIGNLHPAVKEDQLIQFFAPCGEILFAKVTGDGQNLCYGFVEFKDIRAVDEALKLNGQWIMERLIKVGRANNPIVKTGAVTPMDPKKRDNIMSRVLAAAQTLTKKVEAKTDEGVAAAASDTKESKKDEAGNERDQKEGPVDSSSSNAQPSKRSSSPARSPDRKEKRSKDQEKSPKEKEADKDKEKDKDGKDREKDKDGKDRDKDRRKDRSRDRGSRSRGGRHPRDRTGYRDRDRSRDRDRNRDRDRDRDRARNNRSNRGDHRPRMQDRDRDRDRTRGHPRDRDRHRDRPRDNRDRDRDRERVRDGHRSSDKDKAKDRERSSTTRHTDDAKDPVSPTPESAAVTVIDSAADDNEVAAGEGDGDHQTSNGVHASEEPTNSVSHSSRPRSRKRSHSPEAEHDSNRSKRVAVGDTQVTQQSSDRDGDSDAVEYSQSEDEMEADPSPSSPSKTSRNNLKSSSKANHAQDNGSTDAAIDATAE